MVKYKQPKGPLKDIRIKGLIRDNKEQLDKTYQICLVSKFKYYKGLYTFFALLLNSIFLEVVFIIFNQRSQYRVNLLKQLPDSPTEPYT